MAEGTIKALSKSTMVPIGTITTSNGTDLFFDARACNGVRFDSLKVGERVTYNQVQNNRGACAANVTRIVE